MYKLKYADYPGKYHGFTLKEGYYYGQDTETGKYIATSGWENNGCVAVYFLEGKEWNMYWIEIDSEFHIENVPQFSTSGKMSFVEWLEKEREISWNEWDETYSEISQNKIRNEYHNYFYDGIPRFVTENM